MAKVVLITGGSSGIGKALVSELRSRGCKVASAARSHKDKVEESLLTIKADITRAEGIEKLVDKTLDAFGRIDVLINNSGIILEGPFEKHTDEEIEEIFNINVLAHLKLTSRVYPLMLKQKGGHIINIVSTNALMGRKNFTLYGASKFAMRGFSEALNAEARGKGIKVTAVYPGGVQTGLFDKMGKPDEYSVFLRPEDIAKPVADLILSDSKGCPSTLVINKMA